VEKLLVDYVSGEAPYEYQELVQEHLAHCPSCIAFAESYQAIVNLAKQLPLRPISAKLLSNLRREAKKMGYESLEQASPAEEENY
jgi:anti-sigma factor RsiW